MSRLQTQQCDCKACAGELGSFAVLLRGGIVSNIHCKSSSEFWGKRYQAAPVPAAGAWDEPPAAAWVHGAGMLSRPHSQDSLVTLQMALFCPLPCPCEAVAARNLPVTLPLHPHPSAEPFLSLLLVLTEIDFSLDLQVQW